ncbi:hypothetical protein EV424DRAFT_1347023 [Suillus variegatus]|nr:hypothetical protein EV424DRAFT_1347023 [Suillus variegatus]
MALAKLKPKGKGNPKHTNQPQGSEENFEPEKKPHLAQLTMTGSLIDGKGGGKMEVDCKYKDDSKMEVGSESEIDGNRKDENEIKIDDGSESKINDQDPNLATVKNPDAAALKRSQPLEEQSRLYKRPKDFLTTNKA